MAIANERGVFTIDGLVGDRYGVVAFQPKGPHPFSNIVKRLRPFATGLSVTPGESRVIDFKITDLPEP